MLNELQNHQDASENSAEGATRITAEDFLHELEETISVYIKDLLNMNREVAKEVCDDFNQMYLELLNGNLKFRDGTEKKVQESPKSGWRITASPGKGLEYEVIDQQRTDEADKPLHKRLLSKVKSWVGFT